MFRRAKQCGLMLLVVLAGYWLYAWTVVPLVEPPAPQRSLQTSVANNPTIAPNGTQYQTLLARFFPADAWELADPKIIETDHGLFLFRDYVPQEDGRIELKPCTLVILSAARRQVYDPKHPPIITHAPNGAVLQFDRESDTLKGDFGKLRAGHLPGEIRLFRPESVPGACDQLELQTRNIQLNEQQVWTPHEVSFRFGRCFGQGRDLLITLAPTAATAKGRGGFAPAIGGAKTLELVHVDHVHLQTPPKRPTANIVAPEPSDSSPGNLAANNSAGDVGQTLFFKNETTLQIKCAGSFRFDFDEPSATFEKQVDVTRLDVEGTGDQLNCELLSIYFVRPPADPNDDEPKSATHSGPIEIERIVATGHPAILRATSVGATARAEYLEYNLKTRRVQLRDSSSAVLQHEEHVVRARRIEYEMHEQPGRPGRIWADGPGRFSSTGSPSSKSPHSFELTWEQKLLLRPHEENQALTMTGGASLKYGGESSFEAKEIHVWLQEIAELPPDESIAQAKTPRYSLIPDRLLALGDVRMDSARFSGNTKRLEAWFEHADPRSAATVAVSHSPNNMPPPPAASPFGSMPGMNSGSGQKLNLAGELVQVHLARSGKQMQLHDVAIEGEVRMTEVVDPQAGTPSPMTISGRSLHVRDASSGRAFVKIVGQPAEVAVRGMTATADAIQLSQAENRLWVDGPGRMQFPLPTPAAVRPAGQVLYQNERLTAQRAERQKPQPLVVTWKRGMTFDGSVAHFDTQVETRGNQWTAEGDLIELLIVGATLDAHLNQMVSFTQPPRADQIALRQIAYGGNVAIASRTIRDGAQFAFERIELQQLIVDQMDGLQSGILRGVGPGSLTSTRFGGAALPTSNSGRPAGAPPRSGLTQLHVQFVRGLQGSWNTRQIVFEDQVQTVYGPVQSWEEQLRPEPGRTGEDGVTLSCSRLSVAEGPSYRPGQRTVELDAMGNALVETRQFAARGSRISYSQVKEMVVLEGDLRGEAELWQLPRSQAGRPDAIARKIMYWRQDNRIEVDGAKYVDLSRFGNSLNLPRVGS